MYLATRQTQCIYPMLGYCSTTAYDAVPTLTQHLLNVAGLLG